MESKKLSIMDSVTAAMMGKTPYVENEPINIYADEPKRTADAPAAPKPTEIAKAPVERKEQTKRKPIMPNLREEEEIAPAQPSEKPKEGNAPRTERSEQPMNEVVEADSRTADIALERNFPKIAAQNESIRQQEEVEEKSLMTQAGEAISGITDEYPNFWVGAAPMLMGAIMGDIGEGARAGSQGLMQRYGDERDAKQLAYKTDMTARAAARKAASVADKSQKFNYTENGVVKSGTFSPVSGEYKDNMGNVRTDLVPKESYEQQREISQASKFKWDAKAGKHKKLFNHPITGRPTIYDTVSESFRTPTDALIPLDKDQQSYIAGIQKELRSGVNRKSQEEYRRMGKSISGFESNIPERNRIAFKNMAKALEGGKLSDFDMIYLQGTFSVIENARRTFGQQFTMGTMNKDQAKQFSDELTRAMVDGKAAAKERYERLYQDGRVARLTPDQMKEYIGAPLGMYEKIIINDPDKGLIKVNASSANMKKVLENDKRRIVGYE
jgi:hypothetical protein